MSTRPVALITGASSGIGAALADVLAGRGYDLVLLARRRDRLEQVAARAADQGAAAEVFVADLATADGLEAAAERAARGDLRLLVSNAGVGGYAPLPEVAPADVDRLWRLNATAPVTLARAVLPSLLEKGDGGIVTMASLLAFSAGLDTLGPVPMPPRTLYAAAKSATVAFTRTLAAELSGTGVTATVVCPGRVATEWSGGANQDQPRVMSAESVAIATAVAVERGETLCVPGLPDATALDRLQEIERTLVVEGNRAELADRYAPR
ncbi:SDR family NAD(P)-dependent oxidoreductase [Amycolatopsis echigonensis]|uniref:SDR family NAD(P)-dependent oxidoreductase n=1 Tax=Amycolatopsis echigonensis TaxID=2576905 RepID=A0A8E1W249_9PSEU|nr:SDR family NAD(P)-dependent oxidoreductase [Amycolatopsis echigonensis]MBB2502347.1 SDR family NAD(P)-dependent oxidoreductase [Amycolatopsis echigonensis]